MKTATFQPDQIIIKRRGLSLKYRVLRTQFIGDSEVTWALRVKYDKRHKVWVTFGKERSLLPAQYRKLVADDFHYIG